MDNQDASHSPGRVAVIAGAARGVGGLLARVLADSGARVVFVGLEDDSLLDIARHAPQRIETLSLSRGRSTILTALADAWANTPIDLFIDLTGATEPAPTHPGEAVSRSAGLAAALSGGLRAGGARCLMLVPETGAVGRGFRGLNRQLDADLRPARVITLSVPVLLDALTEPEQQALVGQILFLLDSLSKPANDNTSFQWTPQSGPTVSDGPDAERKTDDGNCF